MKRKRVYYKFYLDIEGSEQEVKEIVEDVVNQINFDFEEYEPIIEPFEWRDLPDEDGKGETDYVQFPI